MNYAEEIKYAVPMTEAARFYGFEPNRAGFICCPFHNEATPSCKIYDGVNGWHCYGCGKGGGVIDFVEEYFGLNFIDACKKLNEDFKLDLPIGQKLDRRKQLEAGKEAFKRRQAQKKHEEKLKELEENYWKAFTVWQAYDGFKRDFKPSNPEEINPLYVEAVKNIDKAAYNVDQAEKARDEYVREYNRARADLYKRGISEHEQTI